MIKIEVTGNSIPEVADKLLAIGHSLYSKTVVPIANGGTDAQTLEEVMEAAEVAPVDPTPARKSAPVVEAIESLRTTTETSSTPAPAPSASEDEELEVVDLPINALNYETDVKPMVLRVVQARGKPYVEDILSSFGVAKASMIEPARLPVLMALCTEALAK